MITQNSELRTQNSELRTQNSELRTQNSELRTHPMTTPNRKTPRPAKKSARSAKMLISAAALSVTFGGWIAMANGDGSSSLFYQSPPALVLSAQAGSQVSAQSGLNNPSVDG